MQITSGHNGNCAAKEIFKTNGSKKKINKEKMFESFAQEIKDIVKRDATNGVYMSEDYVAVQNKYVSKVAPDRAKAISQVSQKLDTIPSQTVAEYWMKLLDEPYKASINVGQIMKTAHVYNENGEKIADYSSLTGWTSVPTKAEEQFWMIASSMYSKMFDEARQEIAESAKNLNKSESVKPTAALDCLV